MKKLSITLIIIGMFFVCIGILLFNLHSSPSKTNIDKIQNENSSICKKAEMNEKFITFNFELNLYNISFDFLDCVQKQKEFFYTSLDEKMFFNIKIYSGALNEFSIQLKKNYEEQGYKSLLKEEITNNNLNFNTLDVSSDGNYNYFIISQYKDNIILSIEISSKEIISDNVKQKLDESFSIKMMNNN